MRRNLLTVRQWHFRSHGRKIAVRSREDSTTCPHSYKQKRKRACCMGTTSDPLALCLDDRWLRLYRTGVSITYMWTIQLACPTIRSQKRLCVVISATMDFQSHVKEPESSVSSNQKGALKPEEGKNVFEACPVQNASTGGDIQTRG